jgi:hypothetical protein
MTTLSTVIRTGVGAVAAGAALVALAGPADAASFTKNVYQGTVTYTDSTDKLCVRADETGIRDRAVIQVTLTPYDSSRGPVVHVSDTDTSGAHCGSLATAYEDTHYRAVIKSTVSFDRNGNSTYETTTVSFYS